MLSLQVPGIFQTVVDAAEDQPFLWSIIAVLVIVPGIIVIVFCVVQARGICVSDLLGYFERPWFLV